ncbi:MAG: CHAP domain-containing protein [Bosea sp. (in: a-proteobacteria)]|nr:CHAP domain-containing protein [Bosea sp. (in: a-proteobacteria)]
MTTFGSAGRSLIGSNERWDRSAIQNFTGVDPVTTRWCAYFVSATLKSEGFPSAPSPGQVSSYRSYGEAVTGGPQVGDVAIYPTGSHVGVVTRIDPDGTAYVLSGNYSEAVKETRAEGGTIYRRPIDQAGKTPAEGGGFGRAATDAREGSGKGNTDTDAENQRRAESKGPLAKSDHDDIQGAAGSYSKTSTASIVSRLPSHEPWNGHPKAKKPDRRGFDPATNSTPPAGRGSGSGLGAGGGISIGGGQSAQPLNRNPSGHVTTGDNKLVLEAIKEKESRGDYQAKAQTSSASGAYQFTNGTWQRAAANAGFGGQYPTARSAPAWVQDAVADKEVSRIRNSYGSDIRTIGNVWFTGNPQGAMNAAAQAANPGNSAEKYSNHLAAIYARKKQEADRKAITETGDPGPDPMGGQQVSSDRNTTTAPALDRQGGGVSIGPAGSASPSSRMGFASPSTRA